MAMQIVIQSNGLELTDSLRAYVRRRLQFALGWTLSRRLVVWLSDINGPRGGRDKRCKIQVSLPNGRKSVLIEDTEDNLYAAIDRAAERADHAVSRQLARRRRFTHEKLVPADSVDSET